MRISRIKLKNFRSIKDLDVELPQICALVGPNNAGKSNILLALQCVLGRDWVTVNNFDEDDVYAHDPNSDISIELSFDEPIPYKKFKAAEAVEIFNLSFLYTKYKIGSKTGQRRLEQKCSDASGSALTVLAKAPKKGEQHQYEILTGLPQEVREKIPLIYIGTNRNLKDQLPGARYSLLRQLFEDINRNLLDPEQIIEIRLADGSVQEIPRRDHFERLMSFVLEVLRTDDFKSLEASIKDNALRQLGFNPDLDQEKLDLFFSPFEPMDFYKSLDLRMREDGFDISATKLGEGFQNAIVLAILQAFEERRKQGAIILIEEPEMFLHPQMQRSLYKTIRQIGQSNQVIYTTHSPHFVTVPEYNEVLMVRKNVNETIVCKSTLPLNTQLREKLIKELDPERNEMFFARRLLIVEGDTEKLALPEYAKKLGLDLDREGATIIEAGGKRNIQTFADIAISFEIPTSILYDEDSSDFQSTDEETKFNSQLEAYARQDGTVRVWGLKSKYEDHLVRSIGDEKFQEVCQKFSGVGKPARLRLIASEEGLPIPEPLAEVS